MEIENLPPAYAIPLQEDLLLALPRLDSLLEPFLALVFVSQSKQFYNQSSYPHRKHQIHQFLP